MKLTLSVLLSVLASFAAAQSAAESTTVSSTPAATPTTPQSPTSTTTSPPLSPSDSCTENYSGNVFLNNYCCLGNLVVQNSNYQCIGEFLPLTTSNFDALASSFRAGLISSTTFQTNGAMPTSAPGGWGWAAGVGIAAMGVAGELI